MVDYGFKDDQDKLTTSLEVGALAAESDRFFY